VAHLDVSDILTDPDFVSSLICERHAQRVGDDGVAVESKEELPFVGIVVNDSGDEPIRGEDATQMTGDMFVITRFALSDGTRGRAADTVIFQSVRYTVTHLKDCSNFGRGFCRATLTQLSVQA
jgi:galactose-6-phosphate isomerase